MKSKLLLEHTQHLFCFCYAMCVSFIAYMALLDGGSLAVAYTLRTAAVFPAFHLPRL